MIKAIVFSKDRAMQLDATLRSLYLHCRDVQLAELHVLYSASTPKYETQYRLLGQAYPQVDFVSEKSFREDVEEILLSFYEHAAERSRYRFVSKFNRWFFADHFLVEKITRRFSRLGIRIGYIPVPVPAKETFIFFLVDDNLFVRPFRLQAVIHALDFLPKTLGFSLRLGRNTTYAYMLDSSQELPEFEEFDNEILKYDWPRAQGDYNYPLEVSSSIFRTAQILPLLASIAFGNPNSLEGGMATRSRWFAKEFPSLLCFDTSVTFCNPINKVQTVESANRAALRHHYSVEELAERFDRGERIDVGVYAGHQPNACHQEVELVFTGEEQ
jgi:hypothetical protein